MADEPKLPALLSSLPKEWFTILEWTTLIAALKLIAMSKGSMTFGILSGLSSALLLLYVIGLTVGWGDKLISARWGRWRKAGSLAISFVIVMGSNHLSGYVASSIAEAAAK